MLACCTRQDHVVSVESNPNPTPPPHLPAKAPALTISGGIPSNEASLFLVGVESSDDPRGPWTTVRLRASVTESDTRLFITIGSHERMGVVSGSSVFTPATDEVVWHRGYPGGPSSFMSVGGLRWYPLPHTESSGEITVRLRAVPEETVACVADDPTLRDRSGVDQPLAQLLTDIPALREGELKRLYVGSGEVSSPIRIVATRVSCGRIEQP